MYRIFLFIETLFEKELQTLNFRFSASQSVARPLFREKAPFSVFDFEIQEQQTGNTDLNRTKVLNIDQRLEFFPYLGEIISISNSELVIYDESRADGTLSAETENLSTTALFIEGDGVPFSSIAKSMYDNYVQKKYITDSGALDGFTSAGGSVASITICM